MKEVVIYQSSTGFTKKYAQWIAEELGCEAFELKKVSQDVIDNADTVIFGGWIMGNRISGLDKIRQLHPKNLVIYAVGSTLESLEIHSIIKNQNNITTEPFFYYEGGLNFEKMNFLSKMMIKKTQKSANKKKLEQGKSADIEVGVSYDHTDKEKIKPLIACVRK